MSAFSSGVHFVAFFTGGSRACACEEAPRFAATEEPWPVAASDALGDACTTIGPYLGAT